MTKELFKTSFYFLFWYSLLWYYLD